MTESAAALTERVFSCQRGSLTLRGRRVMPRTGRARGCVILSHGFLANQRSMLGYARCLARRGWMAYCFDFAGGGLGSRSDGKLRDMTVLTEVEDLLAVMDFVRQDAGAAGERPVLLGGSQGGFVSALTAARCPERVARLVLLFPALCIPDDARRGQMMFFRFDPAHIPETISAGPLQLGHDYPACVLGMDPLREIAGYPGRVLIVHGDADDLVPLRYSQAAREAYASAGADCTLAVIPGGGHGFGRAADRQARQAIVSFLEEREDAERGESPARP